MSAILERAARKARELPSDQLMAVAWKIEAHVERAFVSSADATFVWDTRASDPSYGELVVGVGAAASIDALGDERWDALRSGARELFARIVSFEDVNPRLMGGLAFEPGVEPPWVGFSDASFILPRWTLEIARADARVTLVARAEEIVAWENRKAELDAIVNRAGGVHAAANDSVDRASQNEIIETVDEPADRFLAIVDRALEAIADGALNKVVLSRSTRVSTATPRDRADVLAALACEESTTRFAVSRGALSFVGATPERLVRLRDNVIDTEALAGTIARRSDPEREKAALLGSEKDVREHEWVVRAITQALVPFAKAVSAAGEPVVRTLKRVHHLMTPISATVERPTHVLELVRALHPTPAVSGWPVNPAIRAIRNLEGRTRGWYASPIGWFDARGEGYFVVGIRSALLDSRGATVFAGAGIVSGSDPRSEWNETRIKQASMLAALGVT